MYSIFTSAIELQLKAHTCLVQIVFEMYNYIFYINITATHFILVYTIYKAKEERRAPSGSSNRIAFQLQHWWLR